MRRRRACPPHLRFPAPTPHAPAPRIRILQRLPEHRKRLLGRLLHHGQPVPERHRHVALEPGIARPPNRRPSRPEVPRLQCHPHQLHQRRRVRGRPPVRVRVRVPPRARVHAGAGTAGHARMVVGLRSDLRELRRVPGTHLLAELTVLRERDPTRPNRGAGVQRRRFLEYLLRARTPGRTR